LWFRRRAASALSKINKDETLGGRHVGLSKTNVNMNDVFEDSSQAARTELESSNAVAALKDEVRKKSRLIQRSTVEDVLVTKKLDVLDIPVAGFLWGAWKKLGEIHEYADSRKHPADEINLVYLAEHNVEMELHSFLQVWYRHPEGYDRIYACRGFDSGGRGSEDPGRKDQSH
jgi:hypothetical protein